MFPFPNLWKHQKTSGFLILFRGAGLEEGVIGLNWVNFITEMGVFISHETITGVLYRQPLLSDSFWFSTLSLNMATKLSFSPRKYHEMIWHTFITSILGVYKVEETFNYNFPSSRNCRIVSGLKGKNLLKRRKREN